MRRLTSGDALFLYQEEARNVTMHSVRVSIFDPSGEQGGYSFHRSKEQVARLLWHVPPLSWRVVSTPLGLHHPMWIADPDFNPGHHIRRVGCPAPGSDRELAELVSEIAARPLNRARPLWELCFVEGLEGDRIALILKVHHALADGVASARMLEAVTQAAPTPLEDLPEPPPYEGEAVPSPSKLVGMALKDLAKDVPQTLAGLVKRRREIKQAAGEDHADRAIQMADAAPTSLNGVLTPSREFAFTSFVLSDAKAVGSAFGATINDVFLATAAGAIRAYLLERGELPEAPLVATTAVSTRAPDDERAYGNHVSGMAVLLRTDLENPGERLRAMHVESQRAKTDFQRTVGARSENFLELMPPAVHKLMARVLLAAAERGRPLLGNVGLSNVPGPREPVYMAQSRCEAFFSVGPVPQGLGLNITAWSYAGQLNLSLLSCPDTVGNLWHVVDLLRDSFSALQKAADEQPRPEPTERAEAGHG